MGFLVVICTAAQCLAQAPPLPAYLTLPAQLQVKPGVAQEDYGEAQFVISGKPDAIERGKHWTAGLTFSGGPGGADPEAIWAQLKPALVR
ncbi:MAG: hypothetical protein ABSF54_27250, partial [Bryobacteraceae bacterium]